MTPAVSLERVTSQSALPSPPSLALRVLERASRPDCTIGEISALVGRDPALCGQILKLVNSALCALPGAVTSVSRALSLLGLKRVRSLVLALSLPSLRQQKEADPRLRDHWKAWVATSVVARELAARLGRPDPESDLVAGLLCDVGTLALWKACPEEYGPVLDHPPQVLVHGQCELEARLLGLTHAEVGAAILRQWRLPDELAEAVRHHHEPARAGPPGAAVHQGAQVLAFAARVGQLELAPGDPVLVQDVVRQAAGTFGMDEEELGRFLDPLADKVREFAALLNIDMGERRRSAFLAAEAAEQLSRLAVETNLESIRVHEEKTRVEEQRRAAEEALQRSEERLRQAQKMEAIGRLAGGVAHDFNNLLTIINGYSDLLLVRLAAGDPGRPLVQQIRAAGDRAAALTAQLLAFSRKQVLNPAVVDLNAVIRDLDKMVRRLIGENIRLEYALAANLHPVKADPGQVEQILINLLVNARDAMPDGGKVVIETSNVALDASSGLGEQVRPGKYAAVAVSDTGCGMDRDTQARIFEPFFTTKGPGKGTGLGLATVYGIISQSGGHISVYSEPGRGTSFKIYLPRTEEQARARQTVCQPPASEGGVETVLLVEDEDMIRKLIRSTLEPLGYRVLEAGSAEHALEVSRHHAGPIHLLLTDAILPQMSGPQLAEYLRPRRQELKVLYMSGYPDEAVVRHGVLRPGALFLQKPFAPHALAGKVREALAQGRPGAAPTRRDGG